MASCFAPFEDYLQCPVCHNVFSDPVLLMCSHSFCQTCLEQFWQHTESPTCPLCRTSSSVNQLLCNLALKNLCEAFVQERNQAASARAEILCPLHNKKLTLYCLKDKQPACVECQTSKIHEKQCFKLLDEVAVDLKVWRWSKSFISARPYTILLKYLYVLHQFHVFPHAADF